MARGGGRTRAVPVTRERMRDSCVLPAVVKRADAMLAWPRAQSGRIIDPAHVRLVWTCAVTGARGLPVIGERRESFSTARASGCARAVRGVRAEQRNSYLSRAWFGPAGPRRLDGRAMATLGFTASRASFRTWD